MENRKDRVRKAELIFLCKARRKYIQILEKLLRTHDSSDILVQQMTKTVDALANEIVEKLEVFFRDTKIDTSLKQTGTPKIMAIFKNVHMESSSIKLMASDL